MLGACEELPTCAPQQEALHRDGGGSLWGNCARRLIPRGGVGSRRPWKGLGEALPCVLSQFWCWCVLSAPEGALCCALPVCVVDGRRDVMPGVNKVFCDRGARNCEAVLCA